MELLGEVTIPASRQLVWDALNDPATLKACIPGCEELVDESPTVRRARVMVKMGPVRARFSGKVTLSELDPPQGCLLQFEGSGGAAGMASGQSRVALMEVEGGTRVTYTVKASVGGKLGQIGGRMLDASARQLADQFFAALRERLAPAPAETPEANTTPSVDASTTGVVLSPQDGPQQTSTVSASAPVSMTPPPPAPGEASRLLWFAMGALSTAIGVWIGARCF